MCFLRAQKLLFAIAQPCQGQRAKALPGTDQAAVRHCWSNKPTRFLQLTRQSSQFELRALPVTGWKSQMLKEWPQLLPSPCSIRDISRHHTGDVLLSPRPAQPKGPVWPEHSWLGDTGVGQWAEKGFAEVPASSHSSTAFQFLEEPAAAVQTHTEQSTHLFVLKPFTLRGCD